MPPKIICADESPICCRGIEGLLKPHGISVTGTAQSALELQEKIEQIACDAIVCEMRLSDTDMLDVWLEIRRTHPDIQMLIYTFHENPSYVARASSLGAFDFLLKSFPSERLVKSVHALERKVTPESSVLHRARSFLRKHHNVQNTPLESLTKREVQVLVHLALGLSNRDISASLEISLETVKEHVQNVLRKVKANDRTAAAVWAIRNGIPMLNLDDIATEPLVENPSANSVASEHSTSNATSSGSNVSATAPVAPEHPFGVKRFDTVEPRHNHHQYNAIDRLDIRNESNS